MKKIILAICLLLAFSSPSLAANIASPSSRRQEQLELRQTSREQFREKLQLIKDERKQQIIEHINQQLILINDRATKAMINVLNRLQALLDKIKLRVPAADTTAAQDLINSAQTAVAEQAENEYVIEFTDESGLRVGASAAKTQLHTDLKSVREKIRLARQAVVDVLKAAKEL